MTLAVDFFFFKNRVHLNDQHIFFEMHDNFSYLNLEKLH